MFQTSQDKYHALRSATRYNTDGFTCQEGELEDLSGTGMKIRFPGKPGIKVGAMKDFRVSCAGQAIKVSGRVVWVKRCSLFGKEYEAGVHFLNLRPELQCAIEEFAMHGVLGATSKGSGFPSSGKKKSARVKVESADHYAALGLPRNANAEQVHEAYRQLAKRLHPDINKEPDAADRFKVVTEAYRVLNDEHLRTQYDLNNAA